MQVNKFMTMVVGLVVGVLLISGVVAPVIANVSSDGGGSAKSYTIPGDNRISFADANTNITFYPVAEGQYSLQPDTVPDRTIYTLDADWGEIIFCYREDISNYVSFSPDMVDEEPLFNESYSSISVVNDVYTLYYPDGSERAGGDPVWYFTNPLGDFVETVSYRDVGYYYETPYAFRDTPFVLYLDILQNNGEDVNSYVVIYGSVDDNTVIADSENHTFGKSATFSINNDVLTSVSLSIDGEEYTVPLLSGAFESNDGLDIEGYTFQEYSLILPVNVIEGEGKKIPSVVPPTEMKMDMEMGHFTNNIPEFGIMFEKGVDERGNPCFVYSNQDNPTIYAHPGEILYASQHCTAFVEDDSNNEAYVRAVYLTTESDDSLSPNDTIALNSVYIERTQYNTMQLTLDNLAPNIAPATDPNYGVFFPMYNEGISEWDGFIERGIYTIRDGNARVGSLPIIGGVYNSDSSYILPSLFNGYIYNGSAVTFEYDLSDGVVSNLHGQVSGEYNEVFDNGYSVLGYDLVIPEDDGGDSGGDSGGSGNGASSIIKTTLSVIPLVMTVGLVLGAVAFFRMKN